jgi:hypothetical protein
MCQLHACERDGCRARGLQSEHGSTALLDRSVILLDDVVEIPARADQDRPPWILLL